MTARKKTTSAEDLKPRGIKSGSKEAGSIKGGVKPVDKSSAKLHLACATGEHIKE